MYHVGAKTTLKTTPFVTLQVGRLHGHTARRPSLNGKQKQGIIVKTNHSKLIATVKKTINEIIFTPKIKHDQFVEDKYRALHIASP